MIFLRKYLILAVALCVSVHLTAAVTPKYDELRNEAEKNYDFIVGLRRRLHRQPELMYQEYKTSEVIKGALDSLGIKYTAGWGKNTRQDRIPGIGATGIVAELGTGEPPCVALRSDIDALPIKEKVDLEFKSEIDGCMHACGHDGHMSMLLGAAKILKDNEAHINGTVRLIFQPAEEGGAGGKRMREEGVLELYPPVQRIFGLHLWPTLPSGVLGGRAGPLLAACDLFEITIAGVGGHAALPHLTIDPIVAASAIISNLQSVVSRELSPLSSGVISVTKIHGGDAFNVIPDAVTIGGTIRSLTDTGLDFLRSRLNGIATSVAHAHRCNVSMTFMPDPYPPTVNNADLWQFVRRVGAAVSSNGTVVEVQPTMAGEDFAFFAQAVPGAFILLGQGSGSAEGGLATDFGLHNPRFTLHERVLKTGAALHAHLAFQSLEDLNNPMVDHNAAAGISGSSEL